MHNSTTHREVISVKSAAIKVSVFVVVETNAPAEYFARLYVAV
jgi:hypothetical protein